MSNKSFEGRDLAKRGAGMTAIALEVSARLRRLAEPIPAGDRVKQQIARAARRAGLTYSRARSLWYGNGRRIEAVELEAIRAAGGAIQKPDGGDGERLQTLEAEVAELRRELAAALGRPTWAPDAEA